MTSVRVLHGDCLAILPTLESASVDSIVTDPPYELGFMGKTWDASGIAYNVELWRQCLRVLKPGGHLLAFGGTRTYHRMAVAIETAEFEIRDSIHWLYGSGFPKSLDVSKAIDKAAGAEREKVRFAARPATSGTMSGTSDSRPWIERSRELGYNEVAGRIPVTDAARQWEGWGTALKPAHEPIVVARKPLVGTVAANVLEHGTGALNIDGCRVANTGESIARVAGAGILGGTTDGYDRPWKHDPAAVAERQRRADIAIDKANKLGRWPANLVLTHAVDCADTCAPSCPVAALDAQSGVSRSIGRAAFGPRSVYGADASDYDITGHEIGYGDSGGASRFFTVADWDPIADAVPFAYIAKPSRAERDAGLDGLPLRFAPTMNDGIGAVPHNAERASPKANTHPTVKPVELMRWLVRLVTPTGGTVLDPFAGSGTTLVAARLEGFAAVGIEMTADYLPIIEGRIAWAERSGHRGTSRAARTALNDQPSLFEEGQT